GRHVPLPRRQRKGARLFPLPELIRYDSRAPARLIASFRAGKRAFVQQLLVKRESFGARLLVDAQAGREQKRLTPDLTLRIRGHDLIERLARRQGFPVPVKGVCEAHLGQWNVRLGGKEPDVLVV